jgi:hypothetical protein
VTLLVGDSGTGKTTILEEVQRTSSGLAPPPVQVSRSPGSLQLALLEAEGACAALLANDETAAGRIGRIIVEATNRVTETRVKALRAAVGRHLLGIVRTRISSELGDLLEEFSTALTTSASESLEARIAAAGDRDVVRQVLDLAAELKDLAGSDDIFIALDNLDRLDDGDLRRLQDMVGAIPAGVHIRGTFTTVGMGSRRAADQLGIAGATLVELSGIDEGSVIEWLDEEGFDSRLAGDVIRATNGYPAHVVDAIALLRQSSSSETLRGITPDSVILLRTREAWRDLSIDARNAAAKLSAYSDPIGPERVCALLGSDPVAWGIIETELCDAGIIIGDVRRWFHELRRRAIWDHLLTPEARARAVEAATSELVARLGRPHPTANDFVEFALLASQNDALRRGDSRLDAVLSATIEEIALAAAALELIEFSHGHRAIGAESLIGYARDAYSAIVEPVGSLGELAARGLFHMARTDDAIAISPTWGTEEAVAAVRGRAALELGRLPTVQLATTVFESSLKELLGEFVFAKYGVGIPSLREACSDIAQLRSTPANGVVDFRRNQFGLVVRGSIGRVPIYAMVVYDDEPQRDAARFRMYGLRSEASGNSFVPQDVVAVPETAVPSLRFGRAITWLKGREDFSLHPLTPVESPTRMSLAEQAEVRRVVRAVVRARSGELERFAYGLERPSGYAHADSGTAQVIVRLGNFEGLLALPDSWCQDIDSLEGRLRLDHEVSQLNATVDHVRLHWPAGTKDPLTDEVVELCGSAAAFNRHQIGIDVDLDGEGLSRMLREAAQRRAEDGRAFLEQLTGMGLAEPSPSTCYAILMLDDPDPRLVPGANAILCTTVCPDRGSGDVELRVMRLSEVRSSGRTFLECFNYIFGLPLEDLKSHSVGVAIGGLSRLLGYAEREVRFRYPDPS